MKRRTKGSDAGAGDDEFSSSRGGGRGDGRGYGDTKGNGRGDGSRYRATSIHQEPNHTPSKEQNPCLILKGRG